MVAPVVEKRAEQVDEVEQTEEFRVLATVVPAEDGSVTLPPEVMAVLGVGPHDVLMVVEMPQGVVVSTRSRVVNWALDSIGAELRANGVTLEELIESGREIRGELLWEMYGIRAPDDE